MALQSAPPTQVVLDQAVTGAARLTQGLQNEDSVRASVCEKDEHRQQVDLTLPPQKRPGP
jgi:hypothetical protein